MNDIDVSSGDNKTVVIPSQMDDNVSNSSDDKLKIDDSAMCSTAEGVSVEDNSSSESDHVCSGEVPIEDQDWFQSTPPCSQIPRIDQHAKFKERQEKKESNR